LENLKNMKALVIGDGNQQIVRIDFKEEKMILTPEQQDEINQLVSEKIAMVDCVVISDYGKGVCTEKICQHAIETASKLGKTTIVNPKGNNWKKYLQSSIITPNMQELSEVVGNEGTVPVAYGELTQIITEKAVSSKIISRENLLPLLNNLRSKNKKIVFTNGVFDIIHRGHIAYLQKAKQLGDILILGLNTDDSVKRIKGEGRPINNENDRSFVLSAFEFVDYIIMFSEDTPVNLLKTVHPDILVKGADYTVEEVIGREFATKTVLIDFQEGYSSTNIINKVF